jgi:beta-lactamase regulating signal transducer with metallopeptidase domain
MIAAWMLYAALLAALLAAAALTLDHALRLAGRPARAVWMLAIAGSVLAPTTAWIATRRALTNAPVATRSTPAPGDAPGDRLQSLLASARTRMVLMGTEPSGALQPLDRPLLVLWVAASAMLLGGLLRSHRRLRRTAAEWRHTLVDGESVLVAPEAGPAVVGLTGGRIVLPTWALAFDDWRLRLMLAHEREHVHANDPLLLGSAVLAAVFMPWNPALWWQLHRLRLAVEMDCDRRVLRRYPDVAGYGRLLLDVAQRDALGARLPVTALASPVTSLERRIRTMTMRRPRHAAARALGLSGLAVCLVAIACEAPRPPTAPVPRANVAVTAITSASDAVAPDESEKVMLETVRTALAKHVPDVMTTATGQAQRVWFVVDGAGQVVQALRSDAPVDEPVIVSGGNATITPPPRAMLRIEDAPRMQGAPAALTTVNASEIATVEVFKLAPGSVAPDALDVIWIRLRAPGEAAAPVPAPTVAARMPAAARKDTVADTTLRERIFAPARPGEHEAGRDARSLGSIAASGATPLYIVDGREIAKGEAEQLQPSEIASVEVVKGSAAERIYGERAKGGVIRITTKAAQRAGEP